MSGASRTGAGQAVNQRRPRGKPAPITLAQWTDSLRREVQRFEFPADQVMSRFFRSHPNLGARDRAVIADTVWQELRMAPPPAWLHKRLSDALGGEEARQCEAALQQPAPLDLRVNTLLCKTAQAVTLLTEEGFNVQPAGVIEEALRVDGKPSLQKTKAFTQGLIEVQDLGSQLLARLVAPKRGQFVVDFCAGAGGKTLAIGAGLKNTGRLYALDVSAARLARFKPRLARSGLSNVWPSAISGLGDDRVKRLAKKADAVLVDAPCSGMGTLRRNPDLKWRMGPEHIEGLQQQQMDILSAAASLVKPGGRLIYATCSLFAKENSDVVEAFLSAHPDFSRQSCKEILLAQRIQFPEAWQAFTAQEDLMLWPHRSGTDGFYAASLIRASQSAGRMG